MTMRKTTLEFLLYDVLNAQDLTSRSHYAMHSRETFDAMFEVAQEIASKELKPHHRKSDLEEPHVVDGCVVTIPEIKRALEIMAEAGFFSATAPESHGGLQLPEVIYTATHAVFSASNPATTSYMFLTVGAGNLIRSFGTPEQQARYLAPMLEGRWFGTMALSEPHAGSSLAEILTRATPLDDGSFRITGSKMWISGGDHELSENIVHMVLAKLPDAPPGVKGISLFIVPKKRITTQADGSHGLEMNDVALAGLNHKLGARGTTNALLSFGEGNDCRGELVGEPHKGLAYMFQMMNEARISVGLGAASLAQAGFEYSLNYARERRQGRSLSPNQGAGSSHEPVRIIEHSDVKRMLLAQKSLAQGSLALCLYASKLVDDERTLPDQNARVETHALLELLTPIVKAWSSHYGLEANYNAIQVLGGYGYTREYDAEMFYRDNRINPIHEGTNGIQSLDLLGRKAAQENGLGLKLLAARMLETTARARSHGFESHAESLERALEVCENTTQALLAAGNPETMLANSWHYLEMLGHTVIAWLWLEQAIAARVCSDTGSRPEVFVSGILATCQYFYRFELPKVATWGALLSSLDTTTVTMQDDWF